MIQFQLRFDSSEEDVVFSDALVEIGTVSVNLAERLGHATAIVYESEQKRAAKSPVHWIHWGFTSKRPIELLSQVELIREAETFLLTQSLYLDFVPKIDIAKQIRETGKIV